MLFLKFKTAGFLFLLFVTLWSCKSKKEQVDSVNLYSEKQIENTQKADKNPEFIENECDSLKFPDFKENIQEIEIKFTPEIKKEIDSIAFDFIKAQCKRDSLFCDDIYLKNQKHYRSQLGYSLFTFAYAFENTEKTMEHESASFFVFGIIKNGKIIFYDIAEDLIGEIKLGLKGFEKSDSKIIIWGEMNPYFYVDYGKFKLTINGQETLYEFECKSQGH